MKTRTVHILSVMAMLLILAGCSCSKAKVIPRGKMAEIYAEMLVMDQWVLDNHRVRSQADTSLVYEPIFESYGYTTEDYRASVEHYMKDPERYSRILRRTTEILDERILELKEIKKVEDRRKAVKPYRINPFRLYYHRSVQRLWEFGDSVSVEVDSLVPVLEIHFYETSDTTYDGLNMMIKIDSLAVKDSFSVADTVASVAKESSLVKDTNLPKRLFGKTLDSLKRK